VLEVEANDPQDHAFNETDFQELRDAVNSGDWIRMEDIAHAQMWPSFLKAHPEEGWRLFQKLFTTAVSLNVQMAAAESPAWPMLLETYNAEAWQLFEKLATYHLWLLRKHVPMSPAWPMLLQTHNAEARQLFEKLATDESCGVRQGAPISPAWPMFLETHNAEAWQLFEKLVKDDCEVVGKAATQSPAWPMLLETHNAEAWQLFEKLVKDKHENVRKAAAMSPASPMLLETHNAEAWQFFEKLATDEDCSVRKDAAMSPAWPDFVRSNVWEAWRVFAKLMSDQELRHEVYLPNSTAWAAFRAVPRAAVEEHLDSFTPTNLQEMVMSAQKVADNGFTPNVKDLPVVKGLGIRLQRSANETWLGKMAEFPLFAGNAAQRFIELMKEREQEAIKAKEEAEQERELAEAATAKAEAATAKVMILLVIVLLLAVLCIVFFVLWYFYPTIRQWQDEKKLAEEAKQAIRAAEVFDMVISITPEPPAHMAIFDNYQRIYANPYILYKYGYLKEALTQAFRISAEALDVGLHEWDFSAVQKNSTNAVQEMASKSYGMARSFIDNNQAADLQVLMQLCDQIQNDCSPYSSKIEEADMTAVDKCFSMYEQAFRAKRAYFDPLLERIGGKTGAEANLCGEKGILRLAEKNCLRPSGGLIWDCVRAMCVGHDVSELIEVMKSLKDEHDAKRLRIIHVNNRFKRPTSDNWQDIAVYVMFTDPRFSDVVAEIQLTHETFVAVRTKFRAHDAYDHIRFAAEALKLRDKVIVRGVPGSVTRDDQKKDSTM